MFDRLSLALRLRDPWEAVDLGFVLVRAHWRAVMVAWLTVALPFAAALYALSRDHLWVPPLVLWWLKPLLDRLVLHVLARATFGEVPSLRATLRQAPDALRRGLAATLLWRRLSPQRSFVQPVWQLEEQAGPGFRRRCQVLLRRGRVQAVSLTFVFVFFHLVVCTSVLAALALFAPMGSDFEVLPAVFGSGPERVAWLDLVLSLLPIASMALLEPFYVGGGFALYLNRRVELEGWDLEVAFRKAAARIARILGRGVAGLVLACALLAPVRVDARPEPREALAEVLRQPEFQVTQKRKGLHWKASSPKGPETRRPLPDPTRFLKLLALVGKSLLIATAVAVAAFVLWRNRGYLVRRLRTEPGGPPPETLFGLDIRPESLPAGLEGVAAGLWAEGRVRAALALLYRGALAHLVHHHRAPLPQGATEGDCLRAATSLLSGTSADYFARLTRTWREVAYAGQAPTPGSEALCLEWRRHFQDAPPETRP